ncbi:hypothetical protein M501DRAFT_1015607 [Patellaria atrata CBS 101060]|uniref:Uncharacterized protein n=1 Tax=Patellaria atrata CBS 101060 TaxID=1346257 RepID=A0A9P4SDA1_9PEZI|nr:hypothetical protein M501DRAFT_1015607 [Patellaria atrata CBS 101060]
MAYYSSPHQDPLDVAELLYGIETGIEMFRQCIRGCYERASVSHSSPYYSPTSQIHNSPPNSANSDAAPQKFQCRPESKRPSTLSNMSSAALVSHSLYPPPSPSHDFGRRKSCIPEPLMLRKWKGTARMDSVHEGTDQVVLTSTAKSGTIVIDKDPNSSQVKEDSVVSKTSNTAPLLSPTGYKDSTERNSKSLIPPVVPKSALNQSKYPFRKSFNFSDPPKRSRSTSSHASPENLHPGLNKPTTKHKLSPKTSPLSLNAALPPLPHEHARRIKEEKAKAKVSPATKAPPQAPPKNHDHERKHYRTTITSMEVPIVLHLENCASFPPPATPHQSHPRP